MDVDISNTIYEEKIIKVLQKLLNPQLKIRHNIHLESLFLHIWKHLENPSLNNKNLKTFSSWIHHATLEWKSDKQAMSSEMYLLALNLATLISKDEITFNYLNHRNVYERLLTLEDLGSTASNVKLSLISLMSSFLQHNSGIKWIIKTNYIPGICSIILEANYTVSSAGYKFVADVLDKTVNVNEEFCCSIIGLIIQPLDKILTSIADSDTDGVQLRNEDVLQVLYPTLSLITEVMHLLLARFSTNVLEIILGRFRLCGKIKMIILISQTEEFEFELRKVLLLVCYIDLFKLFSEVKKIIHIHAFESNDEGINHNMKILISKGYAKSAVQFCYIGHFYWRTIGHRMPIYLHNNHSIQFEDQLMIIQIMPIMVMGTTWSKKVNFEQELKLDLGREEFIDQTLKVCKTATIKIGYIWRDHLVQNPNLLDISITSLKYIIQSRDFYTTNGGILAYQAFVYCLKDFLNFAKESKLDKQFKPKEYKFLEILIEALTSFIKKFNITRKDSTESIFAMVVEFLHISTWTPKILIEALNLLKITISQYLVPNMTHLIDTLRDASLISLGSLIYSKCQDINWEVRDSSLEVLWIISSNANTKFPCYQGVILKPDLVYLVLNMARNDSEPFVRASALRCLQEIIEVKECWDGLVRLHDTHAKIFDSLLKETEEIVRRKAVTLICKIYEKQYYYGNLLKTIYDVMTHAAIAELDSEVKLSALNFWKIVIKKHLQDQGMIDRIFPTVTFSKDSRKIVSLNNQEINKRLNKVLSQLSDVGCLGVIVLIIQDTCDVQLVKAATAIANDLGNLLKRYQITPTNTNKSISLYTENNSVSLRTNSCKTTLISDKVEYSNECLKMDFENITSPSIRAVDVTDEILEELLNLKDIDVLETLSCSDNALDKRVFMCRKILLSPTEFVEFSYNCSESNVFEENENVRNDNDFESLLDDILDDTEIVNCFNCY